MRRNKELETQNKERAPKQKTLKSATLKKEKAQYRLTQALNAENPGE